MDLVDPERNISFIATAFKKMVLFYTFVTYLIILEAEECSVCSDYVDCVACTTEPTCDWLPDEFRSVFLRFLKFLFLFFTSIGLKLMKIRTVFSF